MYAWPEMSEYVAYTRDFYGVQVGIHPSDEFANLDNLAMAQPGYDVKITLTPSVLVADPNVKVLNAIENEEIFIFELILGSISARVTKEMLVSR